MKEYLEDLEKDGIVVLKNISSDKLLELENIDVFHLDNNWTVLVKTKETLDPILLLKNGNTADREHNLEKSIYYFKEALANVSNEKRRKPGIYAKLGLLYLRKANRNYGKMKQNCFKLSINYLTIATELAKNYDNCYDFIDLIYSIEHNEPHSKQLKKDEFTFQNDLENYYGIENILEIAKYINEGKTIDEVSEEFNLNIEEKCLLLLIYAKECYALGLDHTADSYVKKVLKEKNLSKKVKEVLEEIRLNKRFYKNRINENTSLILRKYI